MKFSFIIPVFNRPEEIEELLLSLSNQTFKDFEVIIVEDGSTIKCDEVFDQYVHLLDVKYFFKENSGPGQSRNYGAEKANGNYFIFLDSDCVVPENYIEIVHNALLEDYVDAFGGPDEAHHNFSSLQKAINYSMTSFFTTGGIRGGSEKIDKFHPRSFNMGYSEEVYMATKGFSKMRFGEDIDMSIRILNHGFRTTLIKAAFVYHKRRSTLKQFFKQVHNSGIARINLYRKYPQSLKLVHFAPVIFTLGTVLLVLLSLFTYPYFLFPIIIYALLIFMDSALKNKSMPIGILSIITSFIQLYGYGTGFILALVRRIVFGEGEFAAFEKTFYD